MYDKDLNKIKEETHMIYSDIELPNSYTFIDENNLDIDIIKIIKKHELDEQINSHALIPNYLKKTEAEEKLND